MALVSLTSRSDPKENSLQHSQVVRLLGLYISITTFDSN